MNRQRNIHLSAGAWLVIIASWATLQLGLVVVLGINDKEEAAKYISAASALLAGEANLDLHHLWYSGYIALHALIMLAGLPVKSMYAIQLVLSLLSVLYFIKIVSIWATSRITVLLSGLLFSTCFVIQQWTTYLYTDPVFASLLLIAIYYLLKEEKNKYDRFIFWTLLSLLPFFRPVGILFVVLAAVYWIIISLTRNSWKISVASAYLLLLGVLIILSITKSEGYFYPNHNLEANIICGLPSNLLQYRVVDAGEDLNIPAYLWNNPGMTIRLLAARLFKVFSLTRPYFSHLHNLAIITSSLLYYLLAIAGAYTLVARQYRDYYFLIAGCILFAVPGVLFCVEWTGRMSVPVILFVLFLGSFGIDAIVRRFILNNAPN